MKVFENSAASTDRVAPRNLSVSGLLKKVHEITMSRGANVQAQEARSPSVRVEDRCSQLASFYRLYESFIEAICNGAQFEINPGAEQEYQESRLKLIQLYEVLRPFVSAYLRPTPDDAGQSARGIRFDAFDALFDPPSLELFLQSDDGRAIDRISRTREALNLYAEHLRQLVEQAK